MGWMMVLMPVTLLVMGVPIFLLLLATCIATVVFFTTLPHVIVHQMMFDSLNKFPLIAVPFFIFTGDLMSRGGISTRLLRWVASMIGGFRASWDMTYVDGNLRVSPASYNSNPGQASPIRNGSYTYHNLQVGYTIPDTKIDFYLGVDNVFDKDPPRNYFGADLGSSYYDNIGRFMYLGATYKF